MIISVPTCPWRLSRDVVFFLQRNAFASDVIPSESYIDAILSSHMQNASSRDPMRLRASLKHVVHTLVKFSDDLIMLVEIRDVTPCNVSILNCLLILCFSWCQDDESPQQMTRAFLPLVTDAVTLHTCDLVTSSLQRILGVPDGDKFRSALLTHVLTVCDEIIASHRRREKYVSLMSYKVITFTLILTLLTLFCDWC